MKYLLLSESEWDTCEQQANDKFGLPNNNASKYARKSTVTNPNNANFGKFIFPVVTKGTWKCDDLFESSELVDWSDQWFNTA